MPGELDAAKEQAAESKERADKDLAKQRDLLHHERRTVTGPLRDERLKVNHLSELAQNALLGR